MSLTIAEQKELEQLRRENAALKASNQTEKIAIILGENKREALANPSYKQTIEESKGLSTKIFKRIVTPSICLAIRKDRTNKIISCSKHGKNYLICYSAISTPQKIYHERKYVPSPKAVQLVAKQKVINTIQDAKAFIPNKPKAYTVTKSVE